MDGSINYGYQLEDEREGSSQYTMAPSSPGLSSPREDLRNNELQHASNLSEDSISSVLRVDVRLFLIFPWPPKIISTVSANNSANNFLGAMGL